MEERYRKSIEQINNLDENSLEQYLITQKQMPFSNERIFDIGYILLKLDRLNEAYSFFEKLFDDDFEKFTILRTGYYKGWDGNWHDYDDSCGGGSRKSDGDGDCCYGLCCCGCCGCWCANDSGCISISLADAVGHICNCVCE